MADLTAYVDEAVADGIYVLAAVLVHRPEQDTVRRALRAALLPRQRRLHWHDEAPTRRLQLASVVGDLRVPAMAVVGSPVDGRRQERARRQCLERLLWELRTTEVGQILAESRQPERDRADISALAAFRRTGVLAPHMTFAHARPLQEEGLWLADIVAGAVLADRAGTRGIGNPWRRCSGWPSRTSTDRKRESRAPAVRREVPAPLPDPWDPTAPVWHARWGAAAVGSRPARGQDQSRVTTRTTPAGVGGRPA